jgi:hypothetical protein
MAERTGLPSIVVRGNNILAPPMLATTDAQTIEFRDGFGDLTALFVRVFGSTGMWGLVTKDDEDWTETLIRFGYLDVTGTAKEVTVSQ